MRVLVHLEGATVKRGAQRIIRELDLTVHEGQHLALIGPNGAGKTTLLRLMAQLLRPDGGKVTLFPDEPRMQGRGRLRSAVGVFMEGSYLYEGLTVEENLQFYGILFDVPDRKRRIEEGLARMALSSVRHKLVGTLSKGMRKRLAIVRATLHQPRLLLLDEPFDGLDERSIRELQHWLAELAAKRCTLVLISHDLSLIQPLCQRVCLMDQGRIVQSWRRDEVPPSLWEQGYGHWLGRV